MMGETVKVKTFAETGKDPFGAPIVSETIESVDNVLVQPGSAGDAFESNRPEGVNVRYTLHFPKTYGKPLEGADIEVRGKWLHVVGAPDHYTLENTPTDWWMTVEVSAVNG